MEGLNLSAAGIGPIHLLLGCSAPTQPAGTPPREAVLLQPFVVHGPGLGEETVEIGYELLIVLRLLLGQKAVIPFDAVHQGAPGKIRGTNIHFALGAAHEDIRFGVKGHIAGLIDADIRLIRQAVSQEVQRGRFSDVQIAAGENLQGNAARGRLLQVRQQ